MSDGMLLEELPNEILLHILSYLSVGHRITFLRCSKRTHHITVDPSLWNHLILGRHNLSPHITTTEVFNILFDHIIPLGGSGITSLIASGLSTTFTDEHLVQVARWCPNLVELDVENTAVTDMGVRYLFGGGVKEAPKATEGESGGGIPPAPPPPDTVIETQGTGIPRCPRLQRVTFSNLKNFTDSSLILMSPFAQNLTHVDLSSGLVTGVRDQGACILLASAHNIESLIFAGCTQISDNVPTTISMNPCRFSLRSLDFNGCFNVTSVGVAKILESCDALEVLDIGFCWRVSDEAFRGTEVGCLELRSLRVGYCYSVSDLAMEVVMRLPRLEFVDLFNTAVTPGKKAELMGKGVLVGNEGKLDGDDMY
ncbi:hypothetical protein HDU67_009413 [Dinochytrium kinnereticum]|nr:hypothetical protein HDU67_009413 [Dinochytrium kinnereticum]